MVRGYKQASKQASSHAHAVLLVWGELRFAPNMQATVFILVASQLAPTLTKISFQLSQKAFCQSFD